MIFYGKEKNMKKRIFVMLACVLVLLPTLIISASAFAMDTEVGYPDGRWQHFQDYVQSGYTARQQNDGLDFLADHIAFYQKSYSKYNIEAMFCGLDLDLYLNELKDPNITADFEGHVVSFSKSYGDWLIANNRAEGQHAFDMCCSYDTVWSVQFYLSGELQTYHGYGEVRIEVGKKALKEGDPKLPVINVYFRKKTAEDYIGAVNQIMYQYVGYEGVTGTTYHFGLNNIQVRSKYAEGFKTAIWTNVDLKNTVLSFLNMNVYQPKGSYSTEFIGTVLGFNPKGSHNGKTCMSRWYYPREFFAGADMIFNNEVVGSASYQAGVDAGYADGVADSEEIGKERFNAGYEKGWADSQKDLGDYGNLMMNMIVGIFEAPAVLIDSMLNFDIFGINIAAFVKALLTLSVTAVIVYFVIKIVKG